MEIRQPERNDRDMSETSTSEMLTGGAASRPQRLVLTPDGKIAGVAAGIGHYLGVDPTIVRLALVLLAFAGGIGILLYLVCWLVMPKGEISARGDTHVSTELLLLGLATVGGPVADLLRDRGATAEVLTTAVDRVRAGATVTSADPERTFQALEQYGVDPLTVELIIAMLDDAYALDGT